MSREADHGEGQSHSGRCEEPTVASNETHSGPFYGS
jgi:hypothetical protein